MGIRLAIGARPQDVVRQVVGEGLAVAALGIVLGLILAAAVGRILAGARGRTDPMAALRCE